MEGFNKASFSDKILPDRVEILSETRRAWTCFIVNLELIFASFFFIFLFCFRIVNVIKALERNRSGIVFLGVELKDIRLGKGCEILVEGWNIQILSKTIFHPVTKFHTLSFASVYCFLLVKRNGLFYWNCFLWPFPTTCFFEDA